MGAWNSRKLNVFSLRAGETKVIASGESPPADVIVTGRFTSLDVKQQVLIYEAFHRRISLFRVDAGSLSLVRRNELATSWDVIVPGHFAGGGLDEVLFFEKTTGKVKIARFSAAGELEVIAEDRFSNPWDIVVAGKFGGRSTKDLVLYDRESGRLKVVRCEDAKLVDTIVDIDVGAGWDSIVTGNFEHGTGVFDGVFFYNRETGAAQVRELTVAKHELVVRQSPKLRPRMDVAVAGRFHRDSGPEGILLYDRETGEAEVHGFAAQSGKLEVVAKHLLPKHVDLLVPMQFTTEGERCDELLVHGIRNRGLCLGFEACADTDFDFGKFFDAEHTVMCWFMPQWVHTADQPVVAEKGSGNYKFGLANYGDGNVIFYKDDFRDQFNQVGSPMLFVEVGKTRKVYAVPKLDAGSWVHLALVRSGNRFLLFVNGEKQTPVEVEKEMAIVRKVDGEEVEVVSGKGFVEAPDLEVPGKTFDEKPSGTLRFGRWRGPWQAYGIIDDAAVFKKALTAAELRAIVDARRLTGSEDQLVACWPFDGAQAGEGDVFRRWTPSTKASRPIPKWTSISASRISTEDRLVLEDPSVIMHCHDVVTPPFKKGEAWRVSQGFDSPDNSHMGRAAFSLDLVHHWKIGNVVVDDVLSSKDGEYPDGTKNAPVRAAVRGEVIAYVGDKAAAKGRNEPNFVRQLFETNRIVSYLHLAKGSLSDVIDGGTLNDKGNTDPGDDFFEFAAGTGPVLSVGDAVAKVGPSAKHLHFGVRGTVEAFKQDDSIAIPCAFRDIEVFDEKTKAFKAREVVLLQQGDIFRRR